MYLMLILGLMLAITLAKHGKRRYRPYLKGQIEFDLEFGSLAAKDVATGVHGQTLTEQAWLSSIRCAYALTDVTPTTQDAGPVMFGVAHSDYASGEIESWIENTGSWDRGNLVQQESAKRKIRKIGIFERADSDTIEQPSVPFDGNFKTTKCGWQLFSGDTVQFWVYNMGSGAFATTTPNMHVEGHANLWPN